MVLLRNADLAMYSAKESGRNTLSIFESPMAERVQRRLELETELRHALTRQEFELYYQPRVDVATGQVRALGTTTTATGPGTASRACSACRSTLPLLWMVMVAGLSND
mgnify:CR=1 FL=1